MVGNCAGVRLHLDRVRAPVDVIDPVFLDTPALACRPVSWAPAARRH